MSYVTILRHCLCQQMQWAIIMHILDKELVKSTWMVLAALAMKPTSLTVLEALLLGALVATQKMLEYDVKVHWKTTFLIWAMPLLLQLSCGFLHSPEGLQLV